MVATVPPEMKLRAADGSVTDFTGVTPESITSKYALRKVSERSFRPGFYDRRKKGFSVPVGAWLAGPWRRELLDRLTDPSLGLSNFFGINFMANLVREHVEQKTHGHRLWALLFLSEWMRQNPTGRAAG